MEGLFVSPGMVKTDFPAKHSFDAYSHSSDVKKEMLGTSLGSYL